jgi:hypothetical protein
MTLHENNNFASMIWMKAGGYLPLSRLQPASSFLVGLLQLILQWSGAIF